MAACAGELEVPMPWAGGTGTGLEGLGVYWQTLGEEHGEHGIIVATRCCLPSIADYTWFMAASLQNRRAVSSIVRSSQLWRCSSVRLTNRTRCDQRRPFQSAPPASPRVPDFAFAFDIDGVLLRSSSPLPSAHSALSYLQTNRIPFILLTNGGGKSEEDRVAELSTKLDLPLDTSLFVQSHTPFAELSDLYDKTVLVAGGDGDKCANVARGYGFKNVVTPGDIVTAYPDIWPFAKVFQDYYASFARPLPKLINPADPADSLKIDAIFVYNDPRDWGLDSSIILDLLLSSQGRLGTISAKNGDKTLANNGWLQDNQPPLYFSNPDLWWAASHPLPRLGQGGFRAAFAGLWHTVTNGAELPHTMMGKPHQPTYEFAERKLRAHRKELFGSTGLNDPLRKVYMVGDNPESDIRGANGYSSPYGSAWKSILVKSGVYRGGEAPEGATPTVIKEDVGEAVRWALKDSGWKGHA